MCVLKINYKTKNQIKINTNNDMLPIKSVLVII